MQTLYRGSDIAGEQSVRASPMNWSALKVPVLYVHGASDLADTWMRIPPRIPVLRAITQAGYTITSHDNGGSQTWGNDTAMSRMTAAYEQLQADSGVKAGKVILFGQSMGGMNSILWAMRNPEKVACMVLAMPVIDLAEVRATPGGYTGLVDTALGVTYSDQAHGLARSPAVIARSGKAPKVPCQLWYGDSDDLCKPSKAIEYATLTGAELRPISGGHAEETVGRIDPDSVLNFLARSA